MCLSFNLLSSMYVKPIFRLQVKPRLPIHIHVYEGE